MKPRDVDAYIQAQAEVARAVLARVRAVIRKAAPRAEEVLSYQMPAYRLPEGVVIHLGAWKRHYALYPATAAVLAELGDALEPFDVEKDAIRFSWVDPVPVRVIERIVRARAREVIDQARLKGAPPARATTAPGRARAPRPAPPAPPAPPARATTAPGRAKAPKPAPPAPPARATTAPGRARAPKPAPPARATTAPGRAKAPKPAPPAPAAPPRKRAPTGRG